MCGVCANWKRKTPAPGLDPGVVAERDLEIEVMKEVAAKNW